LSTPRRELRVVGSIRVLDAVTVGQIAAGEVIDRPASVVKELVENAVDAAAERIEVDLVRGGIERIEVIDDGIGIAPEDLSLALRRYATSKLRVADELERIATLGFRGEGLASIAAVARTEIFSRRKGTTIGAHVRGHAEEIGAVEPSPGPIGTSVTVADLFENVPVRREYLRSSTSEFNRISSWLASFALAYPDRTFSLRNDGRQIWVMPATNDARERLAMVFGRQPARTLMPLDGDAGRTLDGALRGFISLPGEDRPDRRMQLLFVNGRLVRSAMLAGAWTSGYTTFAMVGRHPYGVIFLELLPEHVDPNVHPTKSEVRLRYGNQVFDAVRRAIAATLSNHAKARYQRHTAFIGSDVSFAPANVALFEAASAADIDRPPNRLRIVMQLDRTYVVATDGEAILLIDQHAAHERVAYETIVAAARRRRSSEPLLVPQVVELDAARSEVLDRAIEVLREGGLEIEPFGERSYRIVATPSGYGSRTFDLAGFIDDLTDTPKKRDVRERVWASLACHSVTIAGDRLEPDEMSTLLERLQTCENPMHCPHGRPTMVRLGPDEIARLFKRV
jgi:DNA mismatch repair protein MutL